jgi:hypothetical protein
MSGERCVGRSDIKPPIARFLERAVSDAGDGVGAAGAGGAGAGGIVLTNQNGAVLTLAGRQAGLIVAADLNGLVITVR